MDDRLNIVSSNIGVGNLARQGGQVYTLLTTTDALEIVNQNFDAETIVSVPGNIFANAIEVQDNFFVGTVVDVDVDAETVTILGDVAVGDVMAVSNVDATLAVQGDVFVGADLNDPAGYILLEANVGANAVAIDGDLSATGNALVEGTLTVDTDLVTNGDLTLVGNADVFENATVGELLNANNVSVDNVLYFANALQNAAVVLYGPAHPDALDTYGLGLRTDTLRYSVGSAVARHAFYGNTTLYGNISSTGFRSGNLGSLTTPAYSFVSAPDVGMLSSGVGNLTFAAAGNSFSFASGTLIGNASGMTRINLANTYGVLAIANGGTGGTSGTGSGSVVLNTAPTLQGNVTISGNANVTGRMIASFYQGDGGFIGNVKSTPVGDASTLSNINLANTYGVLAVINGGSGVTSSSGSGNVVLNVAPAFLSTVTFSASGSGPYYGNTTAYNPGRFANITAGPAVFNGNGGVYTSGGGLRLSGQDLTVTPATGAVIEIEGGRAPLGSAQGSEIRFYTSGSQRAAIDKNGNLALGTTSSGAALQITRAIGQATPDNGHIYAYNSTNSSGQDAIIAVRVAGSSAGNPYYSYDVAGEYGWSHGILNSDNSWRLRSGWQFSAGTDRFAVQTDGAIGLTNGVWHRSLDGKNRLHFSSNSTTYFGTQDAYVWRSGADKDMLDLSQYYVAGSSATYLSFPYVSVDPANQYSCTAEIWVANKPRIQFETPDATNNPGGLARTWLYTYPGLYIGNLYNNNDIAGFDVSGSYCVTQFTIYGDCGIGTSSPSYKLDVAGSCRIRQTATISGVLTLGSSLIMPNYAFNSTGDGYYRSYYDLNGASNYYSPNGHFFYRTYFSNNVQTYTVTMRVDNSGNFTIAGQGYKPGGSTWADGSDSRIKTSIELANLDTCYDIVKTLPLKRWSYTEAFATAYPEVKDQRVIGWLADDVSQIFPKAVQEIEDATLGISDLKTVNSDQLVKTMWGALAKAIRNIQQLEGRLEALEASS